MKNWILRLPRIEYYAFTMAEILLSLTIIGVVAAITLPSLIGNINERAWNTQRKALYSRVSQAITMMPYLNNYGSYTTSSDGTVLNDSTAMTFVTEGLSKVYKINNVCENDKLSDCGISSEITNINGQKITTPSNLYSLNSWFSYNSYNGKSYSVPNTKSVAFETTNGESIVLYYNYQCVTEEPNEVPILSGGIATSSSMQYMCANLIYDLNGLKGPNKFGKDIGFITVFNSTNPTVVAPMPASQTEESSNVGWENAQRLCSNNNSDKRLPNVYELDALSINMSLANLNSTYNYWSGSVYDNDKAWLVGPDTGTKSSFAKNYGSHIRCILR